MKTLSITLLAALLYGGELYAAEIGAAHSQRALDISGWSWQTVGASNFSSANSSSTALAISPTTKIPYVAYSDGGAGGKLSVKKFDGGSWTTVGSLGISLGAANFVSLSFDSNETLYVAFQDVNRSYKATVMKFDGNSSWTVVGSAGFSANEADSISLKVASDGTPYVAFSDVARGAKATVMKYSGGSWVLAGKGGFSQDMVTYVSLALSSSGTPYVAYSDWGNSYKATVMKLDTNWTVVGSAGFSAGEADRVSLAIDTNGTPYVAYQDWNLSKKATVMKFDGNSSWAAVASAGISRGQADYLSLAVGADGTPRLAFEDANSSNKASVLDFNGSNWIYDGGAGFSNNTAEYNSLAISSDGTPYVAFIDGLSGTKGVTVMKLSSDLIPLSLIAPSVSNITINKATGSITTNKSATVYYTLSKSGTAPTATQLKAGKNADGSAASANGNFAATAGVATTFDMGSLASSTSYYVYFASTDANGSNTNVTSVSFTTLVDNTPAPSGGGYTPAPAPAPAPAPTVTTTTSTPGTVVTAPASTASQTATDIKNSFGGSVTTAGTTSTVTLPTTTTSSGAKVDQLFQIDDKAQSVTHTVSLTDSANNVKQSVVTLPLGVTISKLSDGTIKDTISVTNNAQVAVSTKLTGEVSSQLKTADGDTKTVALPTGAQTTVSKDGAIQASASLKVVEGSASVKVSATQSDSPQAAITLTPASTSSSGSSGAATTPVTFNYKPPTGATGVSFNVVAIEVTQGAKSVRDKVASRLEASYNSRSDFSFTNTNSAQYIDNTKSVNMNISPQGVASFSENKYFTGAEDIALNGGEANVDTTLGYSGLSRSINMPLAQQVSADGTGTLSMSNQAALASGQVTTNIFTSSDGSLSANAELSTSVPTQTANSFDIRATKISTTQVASYKASADFSNVSLQVLYDGAVSTPDGNSSLSSKSLRTFDSSSKELRAVKIAGGKFKATYTTSKPFGFDSDVDLVSLSGRSLTKKALVDLLTITPQGAATFEENQSFSGTRTCVLKSGQASIASHGLSKPMTVGTVYSLPDVSTLCTSCDLTRSVYVRVATGWNLISNPITTVFDTGYNQLKKRGISKTWVYRNNAWIEDPTLINPYDGVWAKFDGDGNSSTLSLDFYGTGYKPDFSSLPSGWSMLGTGTPLNNIGSGLGLTKVFTFRNGAYVDMGANPSAYPINAGEGFWVKKSISVLLSNGWSCVAVPVQTTGVSPGVFGDIDSAYVWRGGQYVKNPDTIKAGEGVWVKNSHVDRSVTFDGTPYTPNFDAAYQANDWVLLGAGKSFSVLSIKPFFDVWAFKNGVWQSSSQNLVELKAGDGAWIKKKQ